MRTSSLALLACLAACGGAPDPTPARPLGVTDNLLEAQRHDREAEVHDAIADEAAARPTASTGCGDLVLGDQVTSGGERIGVQPCWTSEAQVIERHREEAARLRAHAAEHRHLAAALLAAEQRACAAMPEADLIDTPFAHRDDVAAVAAELDGGRIHGARIRFRAVPGLTAAWLRAALGCHAARAAALGWDATYMGYDPTTLAGLTTTVEDGADGVVVEIHADDEATAEISYRRAEELLAP